VRLRLQFIAVYRPYARYRTRTTRQIPLVILERVSGVYSPSSWTVSSAYTGSQGVVDSR